MCSGAGRGTTRPRAVGASGRLLSSSRLQRPGPSPSVPAPLTSWASGALWTRPHSRLDTALQDPRLARPVVNSFDCHRGFRRGFGTDLARSPP